MPQYGLCLRVTHTGKAGDSVHVSDIRDGVDLLASFRKAGPVYVPHPSKGGVAVLVYSGDVAVSFESGGIRSFITDGYLTAEFVVGSLLASSVFPVIEDEGVVADAATTKINFIGAGVTATQVAPGEVDVTIPGGGGGAADHSALTPASLVWTASAHTGTLNTIAGFDGAGAASLYQIGVDLQAWDADLDALAALGTFGILARTGPGLVVTRTITGTPGTITVTNGDGVAGAPTISLGPNVITTSTVLGGDLSGTLPNPSVVDLTITGEVQGSVLYFNGANWVALSPGIVGEVLTTQGPAANPAWTTTGSSPLLWGCDQVSRTTTTRYLAPGFDNWLAETVAIQIDIPRAGLLRTLRVRHNTPRGNGNTIVYTVRVNGVPTALSVALASTGTVGSDLVSVVPVAAGDLVDIEVTKAVQVGSSPRNVVATVEFV